MKSFKHNQHKNNKNSSKLYTLVLFLIVAYFVVQNWVLEEPQNDSFEDVSTISSEYTEQKGFRNAKLLKEHYEKHGMEMGFASAEEYEEAAISVVNNFSALHRIEAEDGDDVYYIEETNEYVVVSTDGYIRTYFYPSDGKDYFERQ